VEGDHVVWQVGLQVPDPLFVTTIPAGRATGEPPEQHEPGGRCRLQAAGSRVDDSSWSVRLMIDEAEDGSWELHGLGAPRVRLASEVMVGVATSILRCVHR